MKTKVNILVNGKRCVASVTEKGDFKTASGKIYTPKEVAEVTYFEGKK